MSRPGQPGHCDLRVVFLKTTSVSHQLTIWPDHNAGHLSGPINGRNLGKTILNWGNFDFPGLIYLSAHITEKNIGQKGGNDENV